MRKMNHFRIVLLISFVVLMSCSNTGIIELKNCADILLTDFENSDGQFSVQIPSNWESEIDYLNNDTISITSIDTAHFYSSKELRIYNVSKMATSNNETTNYDAIDDFINLSENLEIKQSGKLIANDIEWNYYLFYEQLSDTVTNLFLFKQIENTFITKSCRLEGRIEDIDNFCMFSPLLTFK
jgi:hypothetical protein